MDWFGCTEIPAALRNGWYRNSHFWSLVSFWEIWDKPRKSNRLHGFSLRFLFECGAVNKDVHFICSGSWLNDILCNVRIICNNSTWAIIILMFKCGGPSFFVNASLFSVHFFAVSQLLSVILNWKRWHTRWDWHAIFKSAMYDYCKMQIFAIRVVATLHLCLFVLAYILMRFFVFFSFCIVSFISIFATKKKKQKTPSRVMNAFYFKR